MTEPFLITIITVTYNAEKVIGKTLESLKNQSFKDFEHLIIDGASKDSTVNIANSFGLPQTTVVSEPDHGLYDAMNKGLRRAKGKYVLFLNAGDSFHSPQSLQEYADAALKDHKIIYGDTVIVDMEGKFVSSRHLSAPPVLTKKSFSDGMLICHQAFMVKKDITPEYNLDYRFSADYDWCIRCIEKTKKEECFNLDNFTINYLQDGLSDNNKKESLKERFRIMANHYGLPLTIFKHLKFILRALKRGKI